MSIEIKKYDINGVKGTRWTCETNEEWRHERAHSIGASAVGTLPCASCIGCQLLRQSLLLQAGRSTPPTSLHHLRGLLQMDIIIYVVISLLKIIG